MAKPSVKNESFIGGIQEGILTYKANRFNPACRGYFGSNIKSKESSSLLVKFFRYIGISKDRESDSMDTYLHSYTPGLDGSTGGLKFTDKNLHWQFQVGKDFIPNHNDFMNYNFGRLLAHLYQQSNEENLCSDSAKSSHCNLRNGYIHAINDNWPGYLVDGGIDFNFRSLNNELSKQKLPGPTEHVKSIVQIDSSEKGRSDVKNCMSPPFHYRFLPPSPGIRACSFSELDSELKLPRALNCFLGNSIYNCKDD